MAASTGKVVKPIVYVTRHIPDEGWRLLKAEDYEIRQWASEDPVPRAELVAQMKEADALFCLLTDRVDEELLAQANPRLAVVSTMSVGRERRAHSTRESRRL